MSAEGVGVHFKFVSLPLEHNFGVYYTPDVYYHLFKYFLSFTGYPVQVKLGIISNEIY